MALVTPVSFYERKENPITDEFISSLPENRHEATLLIAEAIKKILTLNHKTLLEVLCGYDTLVEAYSFLFFHITENNLEHMLCIPQMSGDPEYNARVIAALVLEVCEVIPNTITLERTSSIMNARMEKYKAILGKSRAFCFSEETLSRVQVLINELRNELQKSTQYEQEHRERLLAKLEKLQAELHKRMSSLDSFWALLGDAGVAFGKFGNDAKPVVDRVRELLGIAWDSQVQADQLPSSTPLALMSRSDKYS